MCKLVWQRRGSPQTHGPHAMPERRHRPGNLFPRPSTPRLCRHALRGLDVTWVVRHDHIGDAFFDADAAEFLLECMTSARRTGTVAAAPDAAARDGGAGAVPHAAREGTAVEGGCARPAKRPRPGGEPAGRSHDGGQPSSEPTVPDIQATSEHTAPGVQPSREPTHPDIQAAREPCELDAAAGPARAGAAPCSGHALGPTWIKRLRAQLEAGGGELDVRLGVEVVSLAANVTDGESDPPTALELSDGTRLSVDLVVAALGVRPCTGFLTGTPGLELSSAGGVIVDERLQSSVQGVFAAGDACAAAALETSGAPWFQMRLWTQVCGGLLVWFGWLVWGWGLGGCGVQGRREHRIVVRTDTCLPSTWMCPFLHVCGLAQDRCNPLPHAWDPGGRHGAKGSMPRRPWRAWRKAWARAWHLSSSRT